MLSFSFEIWDKGNIRQARVLVLRVVATCCDGKNKKWAGSCNLRHHGRGFANENGRVAAERLYRENREEEQLKVAEERYKHQSRDQRVRLHCPRIERRPSFFLKREREVKKTRKGKTGTEKTDHDRGWWLKRVSNQFERS